MPNIDRRDFGGHSNRDFSGQTEERELIVEKAQFSRPREPIPRENQIIKALTVEGLGISSRPRRHTSQARNIISKAIAHEYRYAALGLAVGIIAILGGILLSINGVAGSTSWTASFFGLKSQLNDAAPGVVLFIVGLFMILVTKPKVRLKDIKD